MLANTKPLLTSPWQRVRHNWNATVSMRREIKNRRVDPQRPASVCSCGCAMTPSYCTRTASTVSYYTCTKAQKQGFGEIPSKSVPAGQIEQFVVERIRSIGSDRHYMKFSRLSTSTKEHRQTLKSEQALLERELKRWQQEMKSDRPGQSR